MAAVDSNNGNDSSSSSVKDFKETLKGDEVEKVQLQISGLLEKMKGFEEGSFAAGDVNDNRIKSGLPVLEGIYSEIVSVQEGVEEAKLFTGGEQLYSKWLELALKKCPIESLRTEDDKISLCENGADDNEQVGLQCLIALAYNNRGYLKYLQVNFEGAIKDYTKCLNYDPRLPQAYYNRGLVTYRLAFFDQSVEDMTHAVTLDPSRVEFQEGLTRAKEMIGAPNGHDFRLQCNPLEDD